MNTPLRCSGMARVLKGSHSFTCTPRVHLQTEWTIPVFAFPAEAGTHLPTPEGWKAELALVLLVEHCTCIQEVVGSVSSWVTLHINLRQAINMYVPQSPCNIIRCPMAGKVNAGLEGSNRLLSWNCSSDGLVPSWSENISVSFCLRAPGYGLTLWCALGLLVGAQYKCLSYRVITGFMT